MKTITFLFFTLSAVLFTSDMDRVLLNGNEVSARKIVLTIASDQAPLLGSEAPLTVNSAVFDGIPERAQIIRIFPLFSTYPHFTDDHYRYGLHQYYVVEFESSRDIPSLLDEFTRAPGVIRAEPSHTVRAFFIPNDPLYPSQWAHNNSGQASHEGGGNVGIDDCDTDTEEAWDITQGSEDVIIAILDTGVNPDHEEFEGRMAAGWDFVNNDSDPSDDHGHGTSCAGIAAAQGNNGTGIAGVAWQARIMPMKVLDSGGSGGEIDIADAIIWATDNNADVISMSLGGGGFVTYLNNAINYATDAGTVVFAASGNDNSQTISYPAAYENCIAVGALSPCNERKNPGSCDGENWWGSNYGEGLDFLAPGVRIHTTTMSGGYTAYFNGTSSACPHAAGIAGLILSVTPEMTPLEVRNLMQMTSYDLYEPGWDPQSGYGRLNAFAAISYSLSHPTAVVDTELLEFNLATGEWATATIIMENTGDDTLFYSVDTTGYSWMDSQTEYISYEWIDISDDNVTLSFSHNDVAAPEIPIPFDFPFYGQTYNSFIVNANGWIGFGADNDAWQNTGLPNPDGPAPAIFGFWDDLNPVNSGNSPDMAGNVHVQSRSDRLVVWFDEVAHWIGSGSITGTYDFQMVLYPDGSIFFNYRSMTGDIHSATIGVQDASGETGLLISYNSEFVQNNFSIMIQPPADWLSLSQTGGTLLPLESESLTVTVSAENLYNGMYFTPVILNTNDFANPNITIPVILQVTGSFCQDWLAGDLNNDLSLNILDIVMMVNIIIGDLPNPGECATWSADLNNDGTINILDVILVLNLILDQ